jgi:hypothetical protein
LQVSYLHIKEEEISGMTTYVAGGTLLSGIESLDSDQSDSVVPATYSPATPVLSDELVLSHQPPSDDCEILVSNSKVALEDQCSDDVIYPVSTPVSIVTPVLTYTPVSTVTPVCTIFTVPPVSTLAFVPPVSTLSYVPLFSTEVIVPTVSLMITSVSTVVTDSIAPISVPALPAVTSPSRTKDTCPVISVPAVVPVLTTHISPPAPRSPFPISKAFGIPDAQFKGFDSDSPASVLAFSIRDRLENAKRRVSLSPVKSQLAECRELIADHRRKSRVRLQLQSRHGVGAVTFTPKAKVKKGITEPLTYSGPHTRARGPVMDP